MATLPLDIQIMIIESVYRSSQHAAVDYPVLLACALVCRAWRGIAQHFLFRRVPYSAGFYHWKPDRPTTMHLLLRTLRTSPHLAAHVRVIHLRLCLGGDTDDDNDIALLKLCPHVTGIFFTESLILHSALSSVEARLRAIFLRPLSLKLWGEERLVSRIVQMWPSVRMLDVHVWNTSKPNDAWLFPQVPSSIESLSLMAADTQNLLIPENGFPALVHLELARPVWEDAGSLHALFAFSSLKTLSICGLFPPQGILTELRQLESLVCDDLPRDSVVLPLTLRHFGHHSFDDVWEDTSFLDLALRTADGLQLFTCTSMQLLKKMEDACRDGGIDLALYQSPYCFPSAHHVDWV
ncbi:hypothetical protein FA95DRAFT_1609439 [Auriscalpium vulgare]|uniref:Uncharacterized protein n=1 Tax=Auriscalpium vulgare TaxID=40419 RepID=A0ACB8RHG9_9AGAM|nr:hypothetical protein FA95DRAFT_1609439 [Auriscalpium vulgare]